MSGLQRRVAIVSTHPIQYYAPVFRALAHTDGLDVRVFYTWSQAAAGRVIDAGFDTEIKWDIPLLDGYASQFVANTAKQPGTHHFFGIDNPTLIAELEAWHPDVVLVYTWNSRSNLRVMRHYKRRRPVLFRGDSTLIDPRPWWRAALRRMFLTWVYRHIDVAIAVGSNNRDYFAWCGIPSDRIAYAPHSIDTVRFAGKEAAHANQARRWREKLGIGAEEIVFLFAGKLQSKKNPLLLLDAFSTLRDRSHLVFVGSGELESRLRSRAAEIPNVHFMPFQNQSLMPAVYRLGDLFVLPSQGPEETWGLALNEAMACGRPVTASTLVGGARDLVRTGENGWMFDSGDLDGLKGVLREAVRRGRNGLLSMGHAAQSDSDKWSSAESARMIAAVCLAAGSSRAAPSAISA